MTKTLLFLGIGIGSVTVFSLFILPTIPVIGFLGLAILLLSLAVASMLFSPFSKGSIRHKKNVLMKDEKIHPIKELVSFSASRMEHRYDHPDIQTLLHFTNDTCFFIRQHLHSYPSEKMVALLHTTLSELKKHYYTLARKYHPDKNNPTEAQQSKQIFQTIAEIYTNTEKTLNDILKERVEWIAFVQDMKNFFEEQRQKIEELHQKWDKMMKELKEEIQKELQEEMESMMERKFNEFASQLSLQEAPQAETIFKLFLSFLTHPQMFYPFKKIHHATNELFYLLQHYVQSPNPHPVQKRLKVAFHHIQKDYKHLALHYSVHKDHDLSLEKEKFALQAIYNIQSPLVNYLQEIKHDPSDSLLKDMVTFYKDTHQALKKRITQLELREIGIEMYSTTFKAIEAPKEDFENPNETENRSQIFMSLK